MNASNRFLIWGTMPLGAALGAGLSGWLGLADTALVAAIAAPLSALPVLLSAVRGVAAIPDEETDPSRPDTSTREVAA